MQLLFRHFIKQATVSSPNLKTEIRIFNIIGHQLFFQNFDVFLDQQSYISYPSLRYQAEALSNHYKQKSGNIFFSERSS